MKRRLKAGTEVVSNFRHSAAAECSSDRGSIVAVAERQGPQPSKKSFNSAATAGVAAANGGLTRYLDKALSASSGFGLNTAEHSRRVWVSW